MKLTTRIGRRPVTLHLLPTGVAPDSVVWAGQWRDAGPRRLDLNVPWLVSGPGARGLGSLLTTMSAARRAA